MPHMVMTHEKDPRDDLIDKIGDIDGFEVFEDRVLVAIYMRPKITAGGIHLTDNYAAEDRFQGKAGLVLKMGADAFVDPSGVRFQNISVKVGDWVWFRPSDGFEITLGGKDNHCRILRDTAIGGKLPHPDVIW